MSELPDMHKLPDLTVDTYFFDEDKGEAWISLLCNMKRFQISLSADKFEDSPSIKEEYLHLLKVANAWESDGMEDFSDWVLTPFLPIFREVPPPSPNKEYTLQQYLFPDIMKYTLRSVEGKLTPCPDGDEKPGRRIDGVKPGRRIDGAELPQELCSSWPSFHPEHIRFDDGTNFEYKCYHVPSRVFIHGDPTRRCFFKPYCYEGTYSTAAQNEVEKYTSIRDAGLDQLRIPKLHGIVQDSEGLFYGLLLSYIDGDTLIRAVEATTPTELRQQWKLQITCTLQRLHEAGII